MSVMTLDVGAGEHPHPRADLTLDLREDLEGVDLPGVDIGRDEWPVETASIYEVVCSHVLEHVPPDRLDHVFSELSRVLAPGGVARLRVPHAGTWGARTDPTHFGGWTPDVDRYFDESTGTTTYWADLDFEADAIARVSWPVGVPRRWRPLRFWTVSGRLSHELVKLPLVDAEVEVRLRRRVG